MLMNTMKHVFDWAGFDGDDLASDKTVGGTLAQLLGVAHDTHPRALALIEEADAVAVIGRWKVPKQAADLSYTYHSPTLAEIGKAKVVFRTCKVICGQGQTIDDLKNQLQQAQTAAATAQAANQASAASSSAGERKIKLSAILSQVDESEAKVLSEKDLVAAYMRYSVIYGDQERPSKESEPTLEQLSAMHHVVSQGHPPYCDFAIWGPYGHRVAKKLKLSGYVIGRDGLLTSIEVTGPTSIGMWLQSWQVFSNVCIMLDIVDLGTLTKYKDIIERFHNRYGAPIWALLYQADNRFRLELVDRTRRQIQAEDEALKVAHGTAPGPPPKVPGYDAKRPWNLAYQRAMNQESYWREEVIEPAMMVLTKVSGMTDILDGDAKVKPDNMAQAATPMAREPSASAPSRMLNAQLSAPKMRPRNSNRTGRHHSVEDGKYLLNRTGYSLCGAFNEGKCQSTNPGGWCPTSWDTVHQCSRCLGQHPAVRCPHEAMPQPNFLKSQKGKGRGRGGGSGGKKGRGKAPQY